MLYPDNSGFYVMAVIKNTIQVLNLIQTTKDKNFNPVIVNQHVNLYLLGSIKVTYQGI